MNKEIALVLKGVKEKTTQLIAAKAMLEKECTATKQKLEKATAELKIQQETIQQLKQQVQALQLTQTNLSDTEKKELAKTIDKYIADINKTIVLLSE